VLGKVKKMLDISCPLISLLPAPTLFPPTHVQTTLILSEISKITSAESKSS